MRIDSHHHLWHYTTEEYGWIDDSMQVLRRDFLPADLAAAMASAQIDGAVAVQARQTLEETRWLLECAVKDPWIKGVVGWMPIAADDFPKTLKTLRRSKALKGLRHVVQGEADGFLDGEAFNRGIAALKGTGLVYDILIFARQLREATRFVDRHPNQSFVLDHIAKPGIRAGHILDWSRDIRELARRPNVVCKLSGMVTEADPLHWTPAGLKPYFDVVLQAFGPARLMMGSDWPVVTVACEYKRWFDLLAEWLAPLSPSERAQVEGETAIRTYGLSR